jgi:hypothetical protein
MPRFVEEFPQAERIFMDSVTNRHEEKMKAHLSSCKPGQALRVYSAPDILNGTADEVSKCRRKFCDKFDLRIKECRLVIQAHHGTVTSMTAPPRIEADRIVTGAVNGATELDETMSKQNVDKPLVLK